MEETWPSDWDGKESKRGRRNYRSKMASWVHHTSTTVLEEAGTKNKVYVHVYEYVNTTYFFVRSIGEPLAPMLFCFTYSVSLSPPRVLFPMIHSPAVK